MKTLFRLLILILFVAGWGLAALSLHVVRAKDDKIVLIPKQKLSLGDTYVDAHTWKIEDVASHPSLVKRILESDKAAVFSYVVGENESKEDVIEALEDALKDAAADAKSSSRSSDKSATAKSAAVWWKLGK